MEKRIENLMDESLHFKIHYALYEMNSNDGYHGNKLCRCFVTIGKEIVFDYPKDFVQDCLEAPVKYAYAPDISCLLQEYVEREKEHLFEPFENDKWELTKVLLACDRRIGKRRLGCLKGESEVVDKIVDIRLQRQSIS